MKNNDDTQTFACKECGQPYKAYPPDSSFEKALISPCEKEANLPNHNKLQEYPCPNCSEINSLYWCQGHIDIV